MPNYRELLQQVKAEIDEVDVTQARELLDAPDRPLVVDVRELDEWTEGRIPGAKFGRQQLVQFVLRDSQDHGIRRLFPAPVEPDRGRGTFFETQAARRRAENDFAALFLDGGTASVVELGERDPRHAHAVALAILEKGFPKDVDAETSVGTIELFVEGTDQDDAPETLYGPRCLLVALQPGEHG